MDDQLLERFIEWSQRNPRNPSVELVPARELEAAPPLFTHPRGEIAEFYSRLAFDDYVSSKQGKYFEFNPFAKSLNGSDGWATFKNRQTKEIELYPEWDFGECIFFGTEIQQGPAFVQLETGVVYGMLPGSWDKYKLAPRFSEFLRAFLEIADLKVPSCDENPEFHKQATVIAKQIVGEECWPGFSEFFCVG